MGKTFVNRRERILHDFAADFNPSDIGGRSGRRVFSRAANKQNRAHGLRLAMKAVEAERAEQDRADEDQRRLDEAFDEEFRLAQMRQDDIDAERWDGLG